VLRFVGIIDVENKTCEVKLDMYPKSHSFAGTQVFFFFGHQRNDRYILNHILYVCIHVFICTYIYACIYICIHVCIYMCICTYMYIYVHKYAYMYMHV